MLRPLAQLGLHANHIGADGANALARCEHLDALRLVDISFGDVTDVGLEAIAGSRHLAGLVSINLAGNPCGTPIEDHGLDPSVRSRGYTRPRCCSPIRRPSRT